MNFENAKNSVESNNYAIIHVIKDNAVESTEVDMIDSAN